MLKEYGVKTTRFRINTIEKRQLRWGLIRGYDTVCFGLKTVQTAPTNCVTRERKEKSLPSYLGWHFIVQVGIKCGRSRRNA